jgi:hypothetical protein
MGPEAIKYCAGNVSKIFQLDQRFFTGYVLVISYVRTLVFCYAIY